MKRFIILAAALVALAAIPASAQATASITYNGNNLTTGTNVCPMSIVVAQGFGGTFQAIGKTTNSSAQCNIGAEGGNPAATFTPECRARVHRDNGVGHGSGVAAIAEDGPGFVYVECAGNANNPHAIASVAPAFVTFGGTVGFRLDLSGTSHRWRNPCGSGDCAVSAEQGGFNYTCIIGSAQLVRRCEFTHHS
jgi:hypothetical protein